MTTIHLFSECDAPPASVLVALAKATRSSIHDVKAALNGDAAVFAALYENNHEDSVANLLQVMAVSKDGGLGLRIFEVEDSVDGLYEPEISEEVLMNQLQSWEDTLVQVQMQDADAAPKKGPR